MTKVYTRPHRSRTKLIPPLHSTPTIHPQRPARPPAPSPLTGERQWLQPGCGQAGLGAQILHIEATADRDWGSGASHEKLMRRYKSPTSGQDRDGEHFGQWEGVCGVRGAVRGGGGSQETAYTENCLAALTKAEESKGLGGNRLTAASFADLQIINWSAGSKARPAARGGGGEVGGRRFCSCDGQAMGNGEESGEGRGLRIERGPGRGQQAEGRGRQGTEVAHLLAPSAAPNRQPGLI